MELIKREFGVRYSRTPNLCVHLVGQFGLFLSKIFRNTSQPQHNKNAAPDRLQLRSFAALPAAGELGRYTASHLER